MKRAGAAEPPDASAFDEGPAMRDQRLELTPALVVERDPRDMHVAIAQLGEHLQIGWKAAYEEAAPLAARRPPAGFDGVVVCGMGGSAIGADVMRSVLLDLAVPFEVVRSYVPPAWIGPRTLVVAVSYSGGTEETLACAEAARERGCRPVCITGGGALAQMATEHDWLRVSLPTGLQPRAAVGFLISSLAAVLVRAGLAADMQAQVDEAAAIVREMAAELGPAVPEPYNVAKALARRLLGRLAVVYGYGVTAPAARRWKTQLNENGKMPAVFGELPELDHNEIVGWEGDAALLARLRVIALEDPLGDERVRRRLQPTLVHARERAAGVDVVAARGTSPLARCLSTAYVGDWVSFYVALLAGVDPTPVHAIERLKSTLAGTVAGD
jgi:glucose/mannose-6-phosphate isomerase